MVVEKKNSNPAKSRIEPTVKLTISGLIENDTSESKEKIIVGP